MSYHPIGPIYFGSSWLIKSDTDTHQYAGWHTAQGETSSDALKGQNVSEYVSTVGYNVLLYTLY